MQSLANVWNYKNIISKAKMLKESVLIVEGIDDVKKFNSIKQAIRKKINVKSIGTFEGYYNKKGAIYVIDFIDKVISFYDKKNVPEYIGYILGIVDRDSLCYKRKETKENDLLYVLNCYSLESFYINKEVIEQTIYDIVTNPYLINEELIDEIYSQCLNESINKLYHISLEALKKSCQSDYEAIVGYKPNNVNEFLNNEGLLNKIEALEKFANENNYDKNMALQIIKGKWFISFFCELYFKKIKNLENLCKKNLITQCNNCVINEINEPCLYKPKDSKLNRHSLEEKIYSITNLSSLTPIKERISQLK